MNKKFKIVLITVLAAIVLVVAVIVIASLVKPGVNGYDMTFTTDANGEILIEGLLIGEYVVTELENGASEGYEIAEPVTMTLVANETLTVNVHNNKITVDVPKTGDGSLAPWIILIAAGLAGIAGVGAYCYFGVYRKGKGGKRNEKA